MSNRKRSWDRRGETFFKHEGDLDRVVPVIGCRNYEDFQRSGRRDVEAVMKRLSNREDSTRQKLLDIGCGLGRTAGLFAEFYREVHGCDISPAIIGKARELWTGIPNLHLDVLSGDDLSLYPAESFDIAYSNGVFEHLRRPVILAYIKEISRVLKVGGRFALEFNSPRWVPAKFPVVHRSIYNLLLETGVLGRIVPLLYMRSPASGDLLGLLPSPKFLLKALSASHLQVDEISGEDGGIFWLYGKRV